MLAKCVVSILKYNYNQCFRDRRTKKKILLSSSPHVFHTTAKLRSFPVVERTRTALKCTKMEKACVRAKRAKTTVCHCWICKLNLPCVMLQKFAIPRNIRSLFREIISKQSNRGYPVFTKTNFCHHCSEAITESSSKTKLVLVGQAKQTPKR